MSIVTIFVLIAIMAAFVIAWRLGWLNGAKTYLAVAAAGIVQITGVLDPALLSTALGVDAQGRAIVTTAFLLVALWANTVREKPGPLAHRER